MKNNTIAIFLAAYLLLIAAHAGFSGIPAAGQNRSPAGEEPLYQLEPASVSWSVRSDDKKNTELVDCDYQPLTLAVTNLDALSGADAEMAARNMENFNGRMHSLMEAYTDRAAQLMDELADSRGGPYYDETSASGAMTGQIISVRLDNCSYTGGAHPNRYTESVLFDLGMGQFTDPVQLADDPVFFLEGAARLLLEKAEAHPSYDSFWQDYADLIGRWNEGTVLFDSEGMELIYSPYEIAPYGMGEVELRLDWKELEPLLGPGGMARLGR